MESFVALDLELTPFAGEQQRIIEIAAVRFLGDSVVDSFATLVDPRCGLTARVEALTGICQKEVDAAPRLETVLPSFLAFLGDDALVGQSIDLDLDCLTAAGVRLRNPLLDTFQLASLLLPGLPAYDLGTIARALGIDLEQEHRALGDATVSGRVFLALQERAFHLSLPVLSHINQLVPLLPDWPFAGLFREAQRRRTRDRFTAQGERGRGWAPGQTSASGHLTLSTPSIALNDEELPIFAASSRHAPPPALRPVPDPVPVDPDQLRSLLRPGGAVASALPGYQEREEQLRMMQTVAAALNDGEHLLVEAGTGTGKSMAYLLPALYYAVQNGRRVAISTNTLNLQDQLFQKDIPALQSCLPLEFRAALLKGRANYLCLRRWLVLSRSPNLTAGQIQLLIKTLIWLSVTETGDRAELNLLGPEGELWSGIAAQVESCALAACPHFKKGDCFVLKARRKAENAHLLVVNHALLLSDLTNSVGVLPEYSHLIVDEAHHLEKEATHQMGFTMSWGDLHSFLSVLYQVTSSRRPAGFLPELLETLQRQRLSPQTFEAISKLLSSSEALAQACLEEGHTFIETLNCFILDHAEERPRAGTRVRITSSLRAQPGWSEIEIRWAELAQRLDSLGRHFSRLQTALDDLETGQLPRGEGVLAELAGFQSYLGKLLSQGDEIISEPMPNGIYWITTGPLLEELAVSSAPLHVGEALNAALFSCKDSVILTSATLTTEGSFDYIKERLGLEGARELMLGSTFDYENSTLLYVVKDIPEPTKPACQRAVEIAITDLVSTLQGRTLVLFTSHAQLRLTTGAIRSKLEEEGILVLAHGLDGSRRRLLQAFKTSPKAVLMGTSSFWEGIDVVGDALSCLVIVKLPFSVPTDPIFAARSEAFDEPFRQYSVPQTILRLKQGFGRLIRSQTDRGVVVILDSRVGSKFYGPAFIHSLPRCTVRMGPAAHVAEASRSWLKN